VDLHRKLLVRGGPAVGHERLPDTRAPEVVKRESDIGAGFATLGYD
jgi:hypothetical protein